MHLTFGRRRTGIELDVQVRESRYPSRLWFVARADGLGRSKRPRGGRVVTECARGRRVQVDPGWGIFCRGCWERAGGVPRRTSGMRPRERFGWRLCAPARRDGRPICRSERRGPCAGYRGIRGGGIEGAGVGRRTCALEGELGVGDGVSTTACGGRRRVGRAIRGARAELHTRTAGGSFRWVRRYARGGVGSTVSRSDAG